jgi:hypothetical protein
LKGKDMATKTFGTAAATSLTAIQWQPGGILPADIANIAQHIKAQRTGGTISPGAFDQSGRVFLPAKRGFIQMEPGDWVAYDANGWPIVVSSYSVAIGTPWSHS